MALSRSWSFPSPASESAVWVWPIVAGAICRESAASCRVAGLFVDAINCSQLALTIGQFAAGGLSCVATIPLGPEAVTTGAVGTPGNQATADLATENFTDSDVPAAPVATEDSSPRDGSAEAAVGANPGTAADHAPAVPPQGRRPNSPPPAAEGEVPAPRSKADRNSSGARLASNPNSPARSFIEPLETIRFLDSKEVERTQQGRVLTVAQDGGLLLQSRDGRLWTIDAAQLLQRESHAETFRPWSFDELSRELRNQLGDRFEIVTTRHYVVATSAGKPYAQWCAALFERLLVAFTNYWRQRGLELTEPEFPLIAVVLRNERDFANFASSDVGPQVASAKGYYSIEHNRIVLYDLTAGDRAPAATPGEIARRVAASPFNIATVIHEATHQMAFNSGLHTRLADNPLWVTEGMAMYFETPDLTSRTGWKSVGQVNDLRQRQFLEALARRRGPGALRKLLESDQRFTDPEQSGDAYAEAWALTYFLARTRPREYVAYLKRLGEKPRLVWDEPKDRIQLFAETFGDNLDQFDADFVRYLKKLK